VRSDTVAKPQPKLISGWWPSASASLELSSGPCDYLLFIDRKAAGVIEAKPQGMTLSGVAEQAER
jgi:hypothetical protein